MLKLLRKEFTLSASPLTYFFLCFTLMVFIPAYPVTIGAFWVCLGIFYTFQRVREENDLTFTSLLPIEKKQVVTAKFLFSVIVQTASIVLFLIFSLVRKFISADFPSVYTLQLLNANLTAAGFCLLIFALFNLLFLKGFFRTAYKLGKPFIFFCIAALIAVGLSETIIHVPPFAVLNEYGRAETIIPFLVGLVLYVLLTVSSLKKSQKSFSSLDL